MREVPLAGEDDADADMVAGMANKAHTVIKVGRENSTMDLLCRVSMLISGMRPCATRYPLNTYKF